MQRLFCLSFCSFQVSSTHRKEIQKRIWRSVEGQVITMALTFMNFASSDCWEYCVIPLCQLIHEMIFVLKFITGDIWMTVFIKNVQNQSLTGIALEGWLVWRNTLHEILLVWRLTGGTQNREFLVWVSTWCDTPTVNTMDGATHSLAGVQVFLFLDRWFSTCLKTLASTEGWSSCMTTGLLVGFPGRLVFGLVRITCLNVSVYGALLFYRPCM